MVDFRSQTTVPPLRSQATGSVLRSSAAQTPFASTIPAERRFKVADLFKFQRGRADLLFSVLILGVALLLALTFFDQSGWADRDLPQKRLGKVLKQPWIGPVIALLILVPAALGNLGLSLRRALLDLCNPHSVFGVARSHPHGGPSGREPSRGMLRMRKRGCSAWIRRTSTIGSMRKRPLPSGTSSSA